jgi:hypothetical protein
MGRIDDIQFLKVAKAIKYKTLNEDIWGTFDAQTLRELMWVLVNLKKGVTYGAIIEACFCKYDGNNYRERLKYLTYESIEAIHIRKVREELDVFIDLLNVLSCLTNDNEDKDYGRLFAGLKLKRIIEHINKGASCDEAIEAIIVCDEIDKLLHS